MLVYATEMNHMRCKFWRKYRSRSNNSHSWNGKVEKKSSQMYVHNLNDEYCYKNDSTRLITVSRIKQVFFFFRTNKPATNFVERNFNSEESFRSDLAWKKKLKEHITSVRFRVVHFTIRRACFRVYDVIRSTVPSTSSSQFPPGLSFALTQTQSCLLERETNNTFRVVWIFY